MYNKFNRSMRNINLYYYLVTLCILSGCHVTNTNMEYPKNIILMIGDGMGLSQISAAMYANGGQLAMEEANYIGLIKTNSASSIITDSAAGATAFATGQKTYNGSINMSIDTLVLEPITAKMHMNNIKTGIISTSSVTHATPACFYGNQINRYGVDEELAKQFLNSNINVLIGGGEDFFKNRSDNLNLIDSLKNSNYAIIDSITDYVDDETEKLINFCAPKEPVKKTDGRGDFLKIATRKALKVLNNNNKSGFFLMVEGSQIDWGGHDMESNYIINETIDFDQAIKEAINFAKKDKNTLVLITADHETGGYGITGGDFKNNTIKAEFLNDDHTATMVPIFAFGPAANHFIGTYHNTEIHTKLLNVFQINH